MSTYLETGNPAILGYPGIQFVEAPEFVHPSIESYIDIGEKRSNSLRHLLKTTGTPFAEEFKHITDSSQHAHHGWHHTRHVEHLGKKSLAQYAHEDPELFNTMETIGGSPALEVLTSAALLFDPFHDVDQLTAAYRNETREIKLKEKKAHGLGAAAMTLALTPQYATASRISFDEAYKVTAAAAIMMMRHDTPEQFERTFAEDNVKAYFYDEKGNRILRRGNHLRALYETDKLDLYSISPSQVFDLLVQLKGEHGFIDAEEGSILGLSPHFEAEHYDELNWLTQHDEPLMDEVSDNVKNMHKAVTETRYFADMGDMICPYTDQFMRTFLTQYSKQRPFWNLGDATVQEASNKVFDQQWKEDTASDALRLMWEIVHIDGISPNSDFSKVPWVRAFIKEHAVMSAILFKDLGTTIMNGDYSVVNWVYDQRLRKLDEKRRTIEEQGIDINGKYTEKVREIEGERAEVIDSLTKKHVSSTNEDIANFNELCDEVIHYLVAVHNIKPKELKKYKDLVIAGEDAPTQPFHNDSMPVTDLKMIEPPETI